MATKGSSRRWLKEHFTDPYVKAAQKAGYRSRAVYKLEEINIRDRLLRPGLTVVDLGAAPGGWSQLAVKLIKPKGRLIAVDLLPIEPIEGVEIIQGDFTDEAIVNAILQKLSGDPAERSVDVVMSDMAPNTSGVQSVDVNRSVYLCELALEFALRVLKPEGVFLFKIFQGEGFDALFAEIKRTFKTVAIRKPKASRGRSRELYVLARNLKLSPAANL